MTLIDNPKFTHRNLNRNNFPYLNKYEKISLKVILNLYSLVFLLIFKLLEGYGV